MYLKLSLDCIPSLAVVMLVHFTAKGKQKLWNGCFLMKIINVHSKVWASLLMCLHSWEKDLSNLSAVSTRESREWMMLICLGTTCSGWIVSLNHRFLWIKTLFCYTLEEQTIKLQFTEDHSSNLSEKETRQSTAGLWRELVIKWSILPPAPNHLTAPIKCKCRKGKCHTRQCECVKNKVTRTDLCKCIECSNQATEDEKDAEDDFGDDDLSDWE